MRRLFLSIVRHQHSTGLLGSGIEAFRRWSGALACRQTWERRSSCQAGRGSMVAVGN